MSKTQLTPAERVGRYRITHTTGTVLDVQGRTELTTFTHGGGGMLYNGSGYIAPPSTSSFSKSWQRVFASDGNGHEWQFEVADGFAVRPGNRVTATYVSKGGKAPILGALRNLDTKSGWRWPMNSILPSYTAVVLVWTIVVGVWGFLLVASQPGVPKSDILYDFLLNGPILPSLPVLLVGRWIQRIVLRRRLWSAMGHA